MLVILGDHRVTDIYVGEFMRLWRHRRFPLYREQAYEKGKQDSYRTLPAVFARARLCFLRDLPYCCDQQGYCDSDGYFDEAVQGYHPWRAAVGD
jgi:hypothetical protein